MKVTSHGAAMGVTGSKHLLEVNGYRILLDCGMFQGRRKDSDLKNRRFPVDATSVDAVILSHAHIDHSGILPVLGKHGYQGRIYTTPATRDLCTIMLLDSANIQERDAEYLSRKKRAFVAPLYEETDVLETMMRFVCVPYGERLQILPDIYLTLHDAGHVLGSAIVCLEYREDGQTRRLIFTGDLGRKDLPILRDPWVPDGGDVLIMESTYGDRDHDPIQTMEGQLAEVVNTTHERGGKLIIPSFALERAQEVIYALKRLEVKQAIPQLPVFVDSPLTVNVTEIFRLHPECFDPEIQALMQRAGDPFLLGNIKYIRKVEQSIALNTLDEPVIIISAAGMCEHGRILHHLKNNCEDPRCTILIVGFQAKHTLGRRIVERRHKLKILGREYTLNAKVRVMNAFSAHAGRTELLSFAAGLKDHARRVLLVHGEENSLEALQQGLEAQGMQGVNVQREGEPVEV